MDLEFAPFGNICPVKICYHLLLSVNGRNPPEKVQVLAQQGTAGQLVTTIPGETHTAQTPATSVFSRAPDAPGRNIAQPSLFVLSN